MSKSPTPRWQSTSRLYREFREFYDAHRCVYAPANPRRIFNLCFKSVYRAYRNRLTTFEFLGVIYTTLGVRQGEPRGLFQTFDPVKYKGKLPLDRHFVNLFKKKLWGKLILALSPRTDQGKPADPGKFHARPELGLRRAAGLSRWDRDVREAIHEALAYLDELERAVIHLTYWGGLSARMVGELLSVDHKTVGRRHCRALQKLREFYGVAA
jgi:hypothetical protein